MINAIDYQNILNNHFLHFQHAEHVLIQDNAPLHGANSTTDWLRNQNINTLPWPSRSPDLNVIENIWGILISDVYKDGKQFNSVSELKTPIMST